MNVHTMKKCAKNNVFGTCSSLNYVLNIFGLSWIYQDGEKLKYSKSVWKLPVLIITLLVLNICSIYLKAQYNDGAIKISFKNLFQFFILFGYTQFVVDITFAYKYGRQSYVDYFNLFEYIDKILGMNDFQAIKKSIRNMCFFFIIIGLITIITDYFAFTWTFGWVFPTTHSLEYVYLAIRMLSALDMISNWTQVKYRLKSIGDLLEDYYCKSNYLPGVSKDVVFDKIWISDENTKKQKDLDNLKTVSSSGRNIVLWLTRCYLLLMEQCEYINVMYGVRLLLACVLHLMDMIFLVNLLIRLVTGTMVTTYSSSCLPIMSTIMRIMTIILMTLCGINRCEQNYRENERIIRLIDHLVINKKTTNEIQETLKELKSLVQSTPINYHANNFFRIDYGSLVSLASVVVTYSIILLQSIQ